METTETSTQSETLTEKQMEHFQREFNKAAKESFTWILNYLRDSLFLIEERPALIGAHKAIQMLAVATEKTHEENKAIRDGLAWIHYKLTTTPHKQKSLDLAAQAAGVLFAICTEIQKKIELVEPPVVKEQTKASKPYVIDATKPTLEVVQ